MQQINEPHPYYFEQKGTTTMNTIQSNQPQSSKKLTLNKETLRRLQSELVLTEGESVHGGSIKNCGEVTLTCYTCPILCI